MTQPGAPESTYVRAHYRKQVVRIPMRDGVTLYTVIFRPHDASPARRYPIVFTRTPYSLAPYDTTAMPAVIAPDPYMLRDGYIFVQQEVRGRYQSQGAFENVRPLRVNARTVRTATRTDEATDAWDSIEWLLRHVPDHNGRVGLHGVSYGGYYGGLAAAVPHPAVRAVSLQAPVADFWFEDFHHNGAFLLGNVFAVPIFGTPRATPTGEHWWLPSFLRAAAADTGKDYETFLALGSLRTLTERWYGQDEWWRAIVQHPNHDAFWQARSMVPHLRNVAVPTLVVGGWYDAENLWGTLAAYRAVRAGGRAPVTLAMGPFAHRAWSARDSGVIVHGALRFADAPAQRFQRDVEAPFFRDALWATRPAESAAGSRNLATTGGALVYDTGRARWSSLTAWPVAGNTRRWYLQDNGSLVERAATATTALPSSTVEFTSDPAHPVPSRCTGPTIEDGGVRSYLTDDQRCLRDRADVLRFVSRPLERDLTVAGPMRAEIVISTSASDLDVVVKVIDVFPDAPRAAVDGGVDGGVDRVRGNDSTAAGREQLVRGEIARARFRAGTSQAVPMRPGIEERITVNLPDVFHTFRAGHRVMIQVHSTWFPLFDRNPQRFVPNIFDAQPSDFVAARHRVKLGARGSMVSFTALP